MVDSVLQLSDVHCVCQLIDKYSCDCLIHYDVAILCCPPSPKTRPVHLKIVVLC
jgi:hypothetical protein